MNARITLRSWLLGLALGVLLILVASPATRWLVRMQVAATIATAPTLTWASQEGRELLRGMGRYRGMRTRRSSFERENAKMREYAQRLPNDPEIQLVSTWLGQPGETALWTSPSLPSLEKLSQRFPQDPACAAAYLRTAAIIDNRREDFLIGGEPVPRDLTPTSTPPAELAAFDQMAIHGEKIDPTNAYFPFMRAAALIAAHKDSAAISALEHAGQMTRWQDYEWDENEGRWRLLKDALGVNSAIVQSALLLTSNLSKVRYVARFATYEAILAERTGHINQGLAIRHALMVCGNLMRTQGSAIFDPLLGIASINISIIRPGGGHYHKAQPPLYGEADLHHHQQEYTHYLTRIGRSDESQWANDILNQSNSTRRLYTATAISVIATPMRNLLSWWTVDILLLANFLMVIFLWAVLKVTANRPQRIWSRVFIVTLIAIASICLCFWLTRGVILLDQMVSVGDILETLNGQWPRPALFSPWYFVCSALVIPTLTLLIAAFVRRLRHMPFAASIQAVIPPIVCTLIILYGILVIGTLRQEHIANYAVSRLARLAGPYLAEIAGETWPSAVR